VTETDWLSCNNPFEMLSFVRDSISQRKLRLFACACCRRIWHLLPCQENRDLVAAVENFPDGPIETRDLDEAIIATSKRERDFANDGGFWAAKNLGRSYYKLDPLSSAVTVAVKAARCTDDARVEQAAQADLLRDLVPNPFRTVEMAPGWLRWYIRAVIRSAQSIYDDRASGQLSKLAHSLEEAGCSDSDIISHCRGSASHFRGCWVVDLLLSKQ
jgi:hypothetical protein